MESPQKKAASMDGIDLLPVTQLPKKTPRMDVVQRVSAWALFTAGFLAFSFGVGSALDHFQSQLTDADIGVLCCFALQAAAAVLALCLPCSRPWDRVRRALAYLALTAVGHCFCAALGCLLLVAGPGDLVFVISFAVLILVLASGDITSFLDLLLGRDSQE